RLVDLAAIEQLDAFRAQIAYFHVDFPRKFPLNCQVPTPHIGRAYSTLKRIDRKERSAERRAPGSVEPIELRSVREDRELRRHRKVRKWIVELRAWEDDAGQLEEGHGGDQL